MAIGESAAGLTADPADREPPAFVAGRRAVAWLQSLATLLERSTCRRRGEAVPLAQGLEALHRLWLRQRADDRAVYWIGNGGSAALTSHLAQDLLRKGGVRSWTFTDPALITGTANDHGYREVFRRPVRAVGRAGDVLMAISSSGASRNVVDAAAAGLEIGMTLVTVSAFRPDNRLRALPAALSFHTPTERYGHAELAHGALLHAAIDGLAGAAPG